jgi:hypothetical protein
MIAVSLLLAPVLAEELSLFRVKITLSANETFEVWREHDYDDLVLALALLYMWGASRQRTGPSCEPNEVGPLPSTGLPTRKNGCLFFSLHPAFPKNNGV